MGQFVVALDSKDRVGFSCECAMRCESTSGMDSNSERCRARLALCREGKGDCVLGSGKVGPATDCGACESSASASGLLSCWT